jgi:hypothetical protein
MSGELPGYCFLMGGSARGIAVQTRCTAPDALSNLTAVLELVADGQVRYTASGRRPAAATVRLVEDCLVGGDYYDGGPSAQPGEAIAAFAWPLIVQVSGLARLAGTRLELSSRGADALARPDYQTLGGVWARWLKNVSFDEMTRIDVIKGQHKPATLTPAAKRRTAVAAALRAVEPGAWADTALIWSVLQTDQARLAVVRSPLALWQLYIEDAYYGSLGHAGAKAWAAVEGRYALCVLFEYIATLGLIDVRYTTAPGARDDYRFLWGTERYASLSRYDGLLAVRVNDLGAAILHDPASIAALRLPLPRPGGAGLRPGAAGAMPLG